MQPDKINCDSCNAEIWRDDAIDDKGCFICRDCHNYFYAPVITDLDLEREDRKFQDQRDTALIRKMGGW